MMQKLSFLCALIINPQALLVDEPLLGLDPNAIENMLEGFVELKNQGASLLLSTHIIDMIEDIWDEAYIMHHGKIINHVQKEDMNGQTLKALFFESVGNSQ
jgi:ABC-type multidrug transport system ATPase subunit